MSLPPFRAEDAPRRLPAPSPGTLPWCRLALQKLGYPDATVSIRHDLRYGGAVEVPVYEVTVALGWSNMLPWRRRRVRSAVEWGLFLGIPVGAEVEVAMVFRLPNEAELQR